MTNTGRYWFTPAAGRIAYRKGAKRFSWFKRWLMKKNSAPDLYPITGYYPMIYPEGYKK